MTFTFAANMTPIMYSTDNNSMEVPPETMAPRSFIYSPPPEPELETTTTTSHSKKKDAAYIPRPPNAFILFRSSFIKAQHIPEKVEGNHSSLSKIVGTRFNSWDYQTQFHFHPRCPGKYWKSLPREERQIWEAKAILALADHRKKYPDWRFRPGSNALAKVKDGPKRRTPKKTKGEVEKKGKNRAKRCDIIADLLVAGKTGVDLEEAIEKYDHEHESDGLQTEDGGCTVLTMKTPECLSPVRGEDTGPDVLGAGVQPPDEAHAREPVVAEKRDTSSAASDDRFCTPLTSMFRRSSSAPASHVRVPVGGTLPSTVPYLGRRDSFSIAASEALRPASASPYGLGHEVETRAERKADAVPNVVPMRFEDYHHASLQPSSDTVASSPEPYTRPWDDVSPITCFFSKRNNKADAVVAKPQAFASPFTTTAPSPNLPAFEHDGDDYSSPVQSPISSAYDMFSEADAASVYSERALDFPDAHCAQAFSQYSSLKSWAGDGVVKSAPADYQPYSAPFVVTPQTPSMYDPEGIMQDAFEAASYAHLGGWDLGLSLPQSADWREPPNPAFLHDYARGLEDMGCRQGDNSQLFSYPLLTAN